MLEGDVSGLLVLLATEVQQLILERGPELQALGHLKGASVERHLESRHKVLLGYVVSAVLVVYFLPTVDGDGREVETLCLKEVRHSRTHACLVDEELCFGSGG